MKERLVRLFRKINRWHFFGIILIFGCVFNFIEYDENAPKYHVFLFSNASTAKVNYVYHLFEHLTIIYLVALLLYDSKKENRYLTGIFLTLVVADMLDYILRNNEPYFYIAQTEGKPYSGFPISYNILQAILFIVFCYIEPKDDG